MAKNEPEKVKIFFARANTTTEAGKVVKSDAEWKKILTPDQFRVARKNGTEAAFSAHCEPASMDGFYECACCGTDLFSAKAKFESGTGWPSFFEPVSELNVRLKEDTSGGMVRMEALCARCDAHLGHVFDDGPPPTGKRYCMNCASLIYRHR